VKSPAITGLFLYSPFNYRILVEFVDGSTPTY